jgi:hypothetical protein
MEVEPSQSRCWSFKLSNLLLHSVVLASGIDPVHSLEASGVASVLDFFFFFLCVLGNLIAGSHLIMKLILLSKEPTICVELVVPLGQQKSWQARTY